MHTTVTVTETETGADTQILIPIELNICKCIEILNLRQQLYLNYI